MVISICVGLSGWHGILITAAIIFPFYIRNPGYMRTGWSMIKRLKWFYLSILLVYIFFAPTHTQTLSTQFWAGLNSGGFRVAILIFIVLAVNLLIRTCSQEQLLSGLYLFITPFKWIGLNPHTFLSRAYLTLDYIQVLEKQLSGEKQSFTNKFSFSKLASRLGSFIASWIEQAQNKHIQTLEIRLLNIPHIWQWTIPILLIVLYIYLPQFF